MSDVAPPTCRLDVWLWRARFAKTRSKAAELVAARGVRVSRHGSILRTKRTDFPVTTGDILTFAAGRRIMYVSVAALGVRRGPPAEARALYVEIVETDATELEEDDGTV